MITRESVGFAFPVQPLAEVAEFLDNRRKPVKESERKPGPFPYYGANGQQGTIDDYIFDEPLILLAEDGGFFDQPDRGIAYRISGKTWVNNHAHVIRPRKGVDLAYLCRVLENYDVTPYISGSTRAKLTKGQAEKIEIPLPSLEKQKRIAAILDQADELRRKRQRALDRLKQLGQATFIEMFGDQFDSSELVRLEDVASQIDYGLTASAEISGDGPKFLRITDIQNGRVDWEAVPVCTASPKQVSDNKLEAGDIVFARTGATTGKSFLIEDCPVDAVFASYLIRVRPAKTIEPEFLFGFFQSRSYWTQISGMAQGAAQPGVNSSKLKELRLPLPSIEAQREYKVARQRIAQQEGGLFSSLTNFDRLFISLQHRAFRGEL